MLPPISIKQIIGTRAIYSVVIDRIAIETLDSNVITSMVQCMGPAEIIYGGFAVYYAVLHLESQSTKQAKIERLNQYVLTDSTYRIINSILFVLFLLIKNPYNAI